MKLVLLADNNVGLSITKHLMENYSQDLSLVVTTQKNEIYHMVEENGIPVCIFDSADGVMSKLPDRVDLGVLAWWPKILKSPLLDMPRYGFINTHPSLLPYNRGKHYNFWALVEQVPFGATLHRVDKGVDTGDIIVQKEILYDWCDNGETLYFKAQAAMISLFCQNYPSLRTGSFESTPQNKGLGSFHYSSEIDQVSHIDLDRMYRGRDLINLLRARTFQGHPGCWFEEAGNRYEISIKVRKID